MLARPMLTDWHRETIIIKRITPFLWFDGKAEQAAKFYVSISEKSKIVDVNRDGKKVMSATFRLNGQEFITMNDRQ